MLIQTHKLILSIITLVEAEEDGFILEEEADYQQSNIQERDKTKVICYRCDKAGHHTSVCPARLLKLQEIQEHEEDETQEVDHVMMHEVVYLNERSLNPAKFEPRKNENNI